MATVEQAITIYLKLREQKERIKRAYEAQESVLSEEMDKIESWLLRRAMEAGVDTFSIRGVGTAYRKAVTKASVKDKDAFVKWATENGHTEAFPSSVKTSWVTDYMEQNNGELPVGVQVFTKINMNINRG